MHKLLTKPQVRAWLRRHGLDETDILGVLDGIDWHRPVLLTVLHPGDRVVQFRDLPSSAHPSGDLGGRWFALPSIGAADMGRVGIGSGGAGRARHELTVARPVEVLESTARPMPAHPSARYRGPGGATQYFIPDRGLSSLR